MTTTTAPARQRSWLATLGLLVGIWAVIAAVVVGWGWLLTNHLEGSVGAADDDLARWIADQRTPTLTDAAEVGMYPGETIVGAAALVVAGIGFALWRRSWRPIFLVALVEAGIGGIYYLGTTLDPRDRPPVRLLDQGLVPDHSFPSGHVGTATALAVAVIVLTWAFVRVARGWALLLLVLPMACLLARLYQGAHHLTDVLTSVAYAGVWVVVLARLLLPGRADRPDTVTG